MSNHVSYMLSQMVAAVDESVSYADVVSVPEIGLEDSEYESGLAGSLRDSMARVRKTSAAISRGAAKVFRQRQRQNHHNFSHSALVGGIKENNCNKVSLTPSDQQPEDLTEGRIETPSISNVAYALEQHPIPCNQVAMQASRLRKLGDDEVDLVQYGCLPGPKLLPNISTKDIRHRRSGQRVSHERITEGWDVVTPINASQMELLGRSVEEERGVVPFGVTQAKWPGKKSGECVQLPNVNKEKLPRRRSSGIYLNQESLPEKSKEEGVIHRLNETIESLRAVLRAHEQKHQCEVLYAQGRINDAAQSLVQIVTTASEAVRADKLINDWLTDFTHRCISTLELNGDEASNAKKHDEAMVAYSAALSLSHATPTIVLTKWVRLKVIRGSANEALGAAAKFKVQKSDISREICEVLEGDGRVAEAVACFRQMESQPAEDMSSHDERAQWKLGFQRRCTERLEKLGDAAVDSRNYNEAAEHFSTILSLDPVDRMGVLVKRSKARVLMKSWEEALSDADEVIKLDASCHRGYELRLAALHGAGLHAEAVEAFDSMLRKIKESPDADIRRLRCQFVDARPTIQRIVAQTIRPMPRILIDTTTGRLYDKTQQAEASEALPIYNELVSSMTTQLDYPRILAAVKEFYQYVMLSHKWEYDEPLFQKVENISIYDLESSSANIKLQKFCSLVRSLGFRWAWSDTCCVDKSNAVVLQESLVAMFTWYRGSSLTVVYLRDVSSESQLPGDLQGSIWNTRAWTYQEYVAAEVVRFYTGDWKPYLGLTLPNHRESPDIISEMQRATGVSAQKMAVLRPGLDRVREKLYLASKRETTLVEDIAYSLFGIFNVTIPVIYGEGNRAVGRLLEHILNGSGDVAVLAWTGGAGSYNSCLPMDLTVYDQLVPPHVPLPMETAEMDRIVLELRSSFPDLSPVTRLYNRLDELPSPSLGANRLKLPGIVFPLTGPLHAAGPDPKTKLHEYRATTPACGDVEIQTADDLTGIKGLCLVHPWIHPLLDQEFSHGAAALDKTTQALRFVARLRQPFGALLFEPLSRVEYRRVATDSLIIARIREEMSLTELADDIRTIEIQ